jgi:protocatechuate 3,4-dioxygenase beta subunit
MKLGLHVVVFAGVGLLANAPAVAQEQRGAIDGVVRDSQGAAVPGVAVVAQAGNGPAAEAVTDGAGAYRFPALPPGRYEVKARLLGFQPARVVGVDLRLGHELQIDVTLQPAGPDETVEVVSESPVATSTTRSARSTSAASRSKACSPRTARIS